MKKKFLIVLMTAIVGVTFFALTPKNDTVIELSEGEMTELNENKAYFSSTIIMEEENGITLELEAWMTDESLFEVNNFLNKETEGTLELEAWMIDENFFNRSNFQIVEEVEKPLELEEWMITKSHFQPPYNQEKPMDLENWLIAENSKRTNN